MTQKFFSFVFHFVMLKLVAHLTLNDFFIFYEYSREHTLIFPNECPGVYFNISFVFQKYNNS